MADSSSSTDHNKILRGKCKRCTCILYKPKEGSNACNELQCKHPSSSHEVKNGCIGAIDCTCQQYVVVENTIDCYMCGHLPKDHIGLGRVSAAVERKSSEKGEKWPRTFTEMKELNKKKRETFLHSVPTKRRTLGSSAQYRKTIKVQLKRPKYKCKGKKKIYEAVGDQRQIPFNKTTTLENVIKTCAKEYLNIDESDYDYQVARQKLELFLIDGKAVVKDPTYPFNRTSFNFVYIKGSEHSWSVINDSSESDNDGLGGNDNMARSIDGTTSSREEQNEKQVNMTLDDIRLCGKSFFSHDVIHIGKIYMISTFCVTSKTWDYLGYMKLLVGSETIGEGGMRIAKKAEIMEGCNHPLLQKFTEGSYVVVKQYIQDVENAASEAERTILSVAKKEVQTQMVCRSLVEQFHTTFKDKLSEFPEVIPCFLAYCETTTEVLMVEEILEGKFIKYMGNDGLATQQGTRGSIAETLLALAHWSYVFSNGEILITDLQGTGLTLTDVELATKEKGYYGIGNVGHKAIHSFTIRHKCNDVCRKLCLQSLPDEADEELVSKSTFSLK